MGMKSSFLHLLCTGLLFATISCTAGSKGTVSSLPTPLQKENTIQITADSFKKTGIASFDKAVAHYNSAMHFCNAKNYDAALQSLDQAYDLILKAEPRTVGDIQKRDELRLTIAKRILEVNSARTMKVTGTQSPIQVPVNNPYVQAEIQRLTGPEREFFKRSYYRSGLYNPYILKKLRERGLPEELAWLPLIESGYQLQALSPARALGLWQFIPSTGVRYGLKREVLIDERMDPEKATDAAISYLSDLHDLFGDWPTALAAYNCGEGRVGNTIRDQHVNYLDNFWDLYERLPRETARYVPRFLATVHIVNNMEKYGFNRRDLAYPQRYDKLTVNRKAALKDIALASNIPLDELKALNPALRYGILPGERYDLKVPSGHGGKVLACIGSLAESEPPRQERKPAITRAAATAPKTTPKVNHKVRKGETLAMIASRYQVPVNRIMKDNGIRKASQVQAGKNLVISGGRATPKTAASTRPAPAPARKPTFTYTVKKGDTLTSLAKRFDTDVKSITAENKLSGSTLRANQQLRIPGTNQKIKSATSNRGVNTYVVQRGDSPGVIAEKHNIPLKRFLQINKMNAGSTIRPGQKVYVK